MISFDEAQILGWITPLIWPFLRALALFTAMPVLGTRTVPTRVRIGLAALIAFCAQPSLPAVAPVPLDSPIAFLMIVQQVLIGLSLGFAVRIVFATVEFAGEIIGLQMGLNFAGFFDPLRGSAATATSRFYGTMIAWLFIVANGHLLVIAALVQSFTAFPVGPEPFEFLRQARPHLWAAEIFSTGLWIALPLLAMLLFVNIVLGAVSRVAPQMNVFSIGFPVTLGVGLLGMLLTLPGMEAPFTMALERLLAFFQ
ncbi:flagellar biosynthetic protein FliR [Rubrivivax gelatinosus]|uniref:Flagellar biosynthetic protein FliR n=1 Tax=Rubrivivax gelatinosus TaxID=28068 RepID=A0ABS1DWX1_RUBGE|nr:flagellar biosynthetic protein FliR [Rubrivivax gelatinosus]MBK1714223.1 flagellar biosynthetic protein FliR [Rubrivivax gelatinosus]